MTNRLLVRWLLTCALLFNAAACSTIKSWFPDKERDYQFRTEIPELIVPEDLKGKSLPERTPEQMAAAAVTAADPVAEEQPVPTDEQKTAATAEKQNEPEVSLTSEDKPVAPAPASNSAVSSLQVDQSRNQAWRLVAKALSRQRMEIVERNFDKGYFYVNYDPEAIKPEDGSIWDEVTFLFGEDPSNEQEYRITLREIAPQLTEVTIQDSSGTTLSNDVATTLLKLITDGINQTLPEKPQEEPAEETSTGKAQENAQDKVLPEKSQDEAAEQGAPDKAQETPTESMSAP